MKTIMCIGSFPKTSTPQVQSAPQAQDEAVVNATDEEKRRRRAAAGQKSTILTSAQGDTSTPAAASGKTLLGA